MTAVCCDSSGNHGQALSWAAKSVGKTCHVAVPKGAPMVKVAAIENYGGLVHFCEPNDAGREAKVPPFSIENPKNFVSEMNSSKNTAQR